METILEQITKIVLFIARQYAGIWPILLITAPLAVAAKLSGIANRVAGILNAKPIQGILLATATGAFSPFCSCSVIPVITSLLIAGVPLAPIIGFWMASPSMDPEIFLLSASVLGWELAVWRLGGTLAISLGGAFITHGLVKAGWFSSGILKPHMLPENRLSDSCSCSELANDSTGDCKLPSVDALIEPAASLLNPVLCCAAADVDTAKSGNGCSPGIVSEIRVKTKLFAGVTAESFMQELWKISSKILMFMTLAYLIEGLIIFYVPESFITGLLGSNNIFSIPIALAAGVPAYVTNLSAMGIAEGLLRQGSDPAAVLAFLLSGATTTLPAMAAVYGIAKRRVFLLYVGLAAGGSLIVALGYKLILLFF
ncbi:MAG: permease [Bacteroidetes bacterium]|nr:permease [Bacteroidota bacterium]